jgi:hypothetical protein
MEFSLAPWSYCWSGSSSGTCADGQPPQAPADIGRPGEVEVGFPVAGFTFSATAERFGVKCGRRQTTNLDSTGPTTYRLRPIGAADDYLITLFGKGGGDGAMRGDVAASFRWHTPSNGPNEAPSASIGILVGDPPNVHGSGAILSLSALRTTPPEGRISASVTVTSADGSSMVMPLDRQNFDCWPEGYVSFTGAKELGERAALLGPAPFRYEVDVAIGTTRYHASSMWPGDGQPECSSCVVLHFIPPLPGL